MTEKEDQQATVRERVEGNGQAQVRPEDTEQGGAQPPSADHRIADLRDMEEKEDQLDQVIEDARGAVAAAHEANSMALPDSTGGDAEEQGPQASG